ncbi:CAF17-like 4Fe-4S cluster assembly/insertion protein YgfZ [Mariniblastus fucicola]|uniref:Putative global regulator n=1 Tax=Mariniblastus fucicola TaxID=980251 RepID=A0A5B9PHS4_9BACT|nr:hypothetical protein [Mariniblastus fucicola]QEG22193.1 putative global regulator [Mariniblastus fucicola]
MTSKTDFSDTCAVASLSLSVIRLSGNDRAKFLHNFCTADINRLQADQCCEAFFLNHKGKTLSHGIVVCREVDLLIVSTAKSPSVLLEHLDRFLLSEDVQLQDVSQLWRGVFVFGGQCEQALQACDIQVPSVGGVASTGFQVVVRAELAGQGILILEAAAGDVDVAGKLLSNGAVDVSADHLDLLRIEKMTPWCDTEVTDRCLPQEFRRDSKAISFTKGCYLGQETVARLDALGHVNRYLSGFEILEGDVSVGDSFRKDEKKIGVVTSLAKDSEGRKFGLGFLRVEFTKPGDTVSCDGVKLQIK